MAQFGEKKVLFQYESATAHTLALAMAKLVKLGYKLLPMHFIRQIWPCGHSIVSKLEKVVTRQKFESDEYFITDTGAHFAVLHKNYFPKEEKKLEHRWVNRMELNGDNIKNKSPFLQNFRFRFSFVC